MGNIAPGPPAGLGEQEQQSEQELQTATRNRAGGAGVLRRVIGLEESGVILAIIGWINPGAAIVTKANVKALVARDASPAGQAAFYKPPITKMWANIAGVTKPLSAGQH